MKKKFAVLMSLSLLCFMLVAPLMVSAQALTVGTATITCADAVNNLGGNASGVGIKSIICEIGKWFNIIIPILIALGVLLFIWGVVMYVVASDEEAKTKGRDKMIMGLIGLAVIVGIWGLVGLLQNSLGLTKNSGSINIPQIPQ